MTDIDLRLRYTVNTLCIAEASLGQPLASIFDEVNSEAGTSLRTLRALVAAGRVHLSPMAGFERAPGANVSLTPYYDENTAGRLIEKHGIDVVAEQVGTALRQFITKVAGTADVE